MKNLFAPLIVLVFALSISAQQQQTFSALDMAGQNVDLADLKGKIVVINLWFVNCPNCIEEITALNQVVDQYKNNKDVVFLGLATSKKALIQQFLQKHPFNYQIIPDSTIIILSKFGTPDKNGDIYVPFPMHYVLDREGNIVLKVQGIKGVDAVKKELVTQLAKKSVAVK